MSKSTHAVVAAFAALLIMGSMRSFGNPVRGIGDDAILGMFSLAVVAVFIFIGWLAVSSLKGGSSSGGKSGASAAELESLKKSVDDGFTNMQTRIDAVKGDTAATKTAVGEVKAVVDKMEGMLKKWAPYLDDLNATINALLDPIGKGVEEIKKATKALNDWKDTTWKKFSDDIAKSVSDVFNKVKTVDVDLAALKGAVGKLDTDQQQIKIVVDDIKKEQVALQKSVTDGFAVVPANVRTEVQKGLDAMQAVLGGKIDAVAANQATTQGMLSGFVTSFSAWQGSLAATLGGLSGSVAAATAAAVKSEVDNIRTDMTRELGAIAAKQTSVQDALVDLTAAQDKMRKRMKKALAALPTDLQNVMEVQLQRVEKVFTDNITDLKNAQTLTAGEVATLTTTTNALKTMVLARLDQNRQSVRDQLNRQLVAIQTTIHDEIEPITSEMFEINRGMKAVLAQLSQQGDALSELSKAERERYDHLANTMIETYNLLEQVGREGAKADALERVHGGVGLIAQYLAQQGGKLDELLARLPAMGPLLDELRRLIEEFQKRQKRSRDKTGEVVARQKDVFSRIQYTQHKFNHTQYNENALLFLSKLVMVRQAIDGGLTVPNMKLSITAALADISQTKDKLCTGGGSSYAQLKDFLSELNARKMAFPPDLSDELEVLTELCEQRGRLSSKLANLVHLCTLKKSTGKDVQAAIDGVISDKAWNEVAGSMTKELKQVLVMHSSAPRAP